jgi:predicted membrane-bound spermidine synthase
MRNWRLLATCLVVAAFLPAVGCGSDASKGVNKDKDRPIATDKKSS